MGGLYFLEFFTKKFLTMCLYCKCYFQNALNRKYPAYRCRFTWRHVSYWMPFTCNAAIVNKACNVLVSFGRFNLYQPKLCTNLWATMLIYIHKVIL